MAIAQIDSAGNRSPATTIAWNVDTEAPLAPKFAAAPLLFSGDPNEPVRLVGEFGATFSCARDGEAASSCPAGQVLGKLSLGPHTLTAWQSDAAGNRSEGAEVRWITVPTPPAGEQGISIGDAAIYVNKPNVLLDLVWPEGATRALISNDGGFKNSRMLDLAAQVPWALISSGAERLPKTVYVRFKGYLVDESKTYTDDVILDQTPPEILSVSAVAVAPSARQEAARRGRAVVVRVKARDQISGVRGMQVASTKATGVTVLPYRPSTRTMVTGRRVWVRVKDGAGNWSTWRRG
jgi:hypothetical protein